MTYTAVVETGSHSMPPHGPEGPRYETKAQCGHAHKTYDAAERCGQRLRGHGKQVSALWYNFRVHDERGHRASWGDATVGYCVRCGKDLDTVGLCAACDAAVLATA